MNKAHRVIWSASQQAFIVVSEHARACGRPAGMRMTLVAVAALGLGAGHVLAAGSCAAGGSTTISSPTTVACVLASGGTLTVSPTGSIQAAGPAVLVNAPPSAVGNPGLLIGNAGVIRGTGGGAGILLENTTANGSVRNTGTLAAAGPRSAAIALHNARLVGSFDNRNVIQAFYGLKLEGSGVTGTLGNTGNIVGQWYAIYVDSSHVNGNIALAGSASGGGEGVLLSRSRIDGTVRETGNLWGLRNGLHLVGSQVAGGISNSGVIASGGPALQLDGSQILSGGIRNTGTLAGTTSGIFLGNSTVSGAIVNSGVITAVPTLAASLSGLALQGSQLNGNIVNSGQLSGYHGLDLAQSRVVGNVTNSGNLSGFLVGVQLTDSVINGNFVNAQAASISGRTGLRMDNSTITGKLINNGHVSARFTSFTIVDSLIAGGMTTTGSMTSPQETNIVRNSTLGSFFNSGSIYSNTDGVVFQISQVNGAISNFGSISGVSLRGTTVTDAIRNGGTLATHGPGALVVSEHSSLGAGITNTGNVSNTGAFGDLGPGLRLADSIILQGGIRNSGSISGLGGVLVSNSSITGNLTNAGLIDGGFSATEGIEGLGLQGSQVVGSIVNSGTLSGHNAIGLDQSTVTGDIRNGGALVAYIAPVHLTASLLDGSLVNTGTASGQSGLFVQNSTVTGQVVNSGAVNGAFGAVTILDSTLIGGVTNSGTLTSVLGLNQISNSHLGSLVNRGTIAAGDTGWFVLGSQIDRSVINSGVVDGVNIDSSTLGTGVQNTGTVTGQGLVVRLSRVLAQGISNSRSGLINGLVIDDSTIVGAMTNAGSLFVEAIKEKPALQVTGGTLGGGLANSGLISGSTGLLIDGVVIDGDLRNSGTINGRGDGAVITGSQISGGLNNSGTVSGALHGLSIGTTTVSGVLRNSGSISARNGALSIGGSTLKVGFINSGSIVSQDSNSISNSRLGSLTNSGTISAGTQGLIVSNTQFSGPFVNSGLLRGGRFALVSDASVTQLLITGANSAQFEGEVLAPAAHVSVAPGAVYTLNNGNLFTVADFTNRGTLGIAANATATIDGNYAQDAAAILSTQASSASAFGKLVVTGNAVLPNQARFNVDVTNSGQSFNGATLANVLSAGTLSSNGTFAVTSNSQLYAFTGVKDGNSVDLVAAPKSTTAVTQALQGSNRSANLSAARALDSALVSNSSLAPLFVGASSGAQVASAIAQTLPSNAAAATQVSQATLSTITDVVQSRINATTGLASGDGFYGDKNLWMKPFGSWINQSEHGGSPGYDASVYGMAFGVDAPVNELLRLGVSFSYANADTNSKADVSSQSAKVDLYQLMGYGSYTVAPNTELSFHAGVGQNRNDGERNINLNGVGGKASANYDSRSVTAGVALAKAFDINPTTRFIPSVRADYTWLQDDSYHEKGSAALQPLLLDVNKHQTDQLILGVDGKLSHEIVPGTQVTGNLGVGYDVIHDDSMLTSTYAGAPGQSFNTVGQSSSPWLARGGAGVSTRLAGGTQLSVNYDAQTRSDFTNQTVSLRVRVPF